MVLANVKMPGSISRVNISVDSGIITGINARPNGNNIHFDDAVVFPGLINSHDHLEFNCFPKLGNRTYESYVEWGHYIHKHFKKEIDKVLSIPPELRMHWGIYKNLLAGVTTVVQHGNFHLNKPLINVVKGLQNLHSAGFEKYWKLKLNNPFKKNKVCVMHAGEGTSERTAKEIDELINRNYLRRKLIAVHAVSMTQKQAPNFKAVVWCPMSNQFLLNSTADIPKLKKLTNICFGTDSTLTSSWNIWEHFRQARRSGLAEASEIFGMATDIPAKVWGLNRGRISAGMEADIVVAKETPGSFEGLLELDPENILMVMHRGNVRLFDESLYSKLMFDKSRYDAIEINGSVKYAEGNIAGLISEIKKYYPGSEIPVRMITK